MAHDYKNRVHKKKKGKRFPTGLLLLALLLTSLFAGFLFFLQGEKAGSSVPTKTPSTSVKKKIATNKEPGKPQFDFYELLPEDSADLFTQPTNKPLTPSAQYLLQAGSFKTYAQADKLKAQLAFAGIISHIKTVASNGKTWHRVQAGPYINSQQLDQARHKLQELKIEPILIKKKTSRGSSD